MVSRSGHHGDVGASELLGQDAEHDRHSDQPHMISFTCSGSPNRRSRMLLDGPSL